MRGFRISKAPLPRKQVQASHKNRFGGVYRGHSWGSSNASPICGARHALLLRSKQSSLRIQTPRTEGTAVATVASRGDLSHDVFRSISGFLEHISSIAMQSIVNGTRVRAFLEAS